MISELQILFYWLGLITTSYIVAIRICSSLASCLSLLSSISFSVPQLNFLRAYFFSPFSSFLLPSPVSSSLILLIQCLCPYVRLL